MVRWLQKHLTSVILVGNGILLTIFCVLWNLISEGFAYEIANDNMPSGLYLKLHFSFFLVMGVTGIFLLKCSKPRGHLTIFLIGFAILFRIILIPSTPIHESDFYRYQWDGKVAAAGINPFRFEPGALRLWEENLSIEFADSQTGVTWRGRKFSNEEVAILEKLRTLRDENPVLFERVSHPAVNTIYPPVAQATFWFSREIFGDSIIGLKAVIVLFDIGVILVTLGILGRLGRNPLGVIFYSWNPLVLKEFANSAHYDSVPIFFTVLAVFLALREKSRIATGISLAAGTLSKFFSMLLFPILLIESPLQKNMNPRRFFAFLGPLVVFGVLVMLAFFPFLKWNDAGFENVFLGLQTYNLHWEYNAGIFALFQEPLGFATAKKFVAGLLVLIIAILTFIPTRDKPHLVWKAFAVVGALFILSPTAFPWYFAWVLPFLCIFPRVSWLLLGALLPINYLDFHSAESIPFAHGSWAGVFYTSWICWGTLLVAWFVEFLVVRNNRVLSTNQPC